MTGKFYYKYIPLRRGLTGTEYLSQWLDEYYPDTSFTSVISDGMAEFGILTGSGDSFSKSIAAIEGNFSAVRLTENAFIGVVKKHYNPTTLIEGETPPTFVEYMNKFGITVTEDSLEQLKENKINLFKVITKKKWDDSNDAISDLAKVNTLLTVWYPDLTTEETSAVDQKINILKNIYTKDRCIKSLNHVVDNILSTILDNYYTKKDEVMAATNLTEIQTVTYE